MNQSWQERITANNSERFHFQTCGERGDFEPASPGRAAHLDVMHDPGSGSTGWRESRRERKRVGAQFTAAGRGKGILLLRSMRKIR